MAFDHKTRNLLQNLVSECRRLLDAEFTMQLQELFGIQPTGAIADLARLTHLTDEQREVGRLLRERIAHLQAGHPNTGTKSATTAAESVQRVIREQAFTVLNRLAALRLSEERGLLIECVRQGFNSEGFQLFRQSAGNALGNTYETYMTYLERLFDELASELGMLFDRFSPMGLLFPRQDALQAILAELNGAGATAAREKLGPDDFARLWQADETIGWIYQYWNDPAERRKMRDESAAPRNSRELAVRNQFFTPRYVVEFLTDNTLGRIWYEMTGGETRLKEQCRYLVRRPNEIFLKEGETAPEQPKQDNLSQEELLKQPVYIPHRPLKDPRTILMLDPACGSMHFGLYAFDLFEVIYEEAWDLAKSGEIPPGADESFSEFCDLISEASLPTSSGKSIHSSIHPTIRSKEEFLRQVPRLTIEYNLHGIDIDPRCAQIAGLSLWLRAQKSWQRLNLKHAERPTIKRSNIVCAEPMPGEKELMKEFVEREFPIEERPIFLRLLQTIFDKMQLAGEAGSLLKIEEEIKTAIEGARQQWQAGRERPEFFDPAQIAKLDNRGGAQQELSAAPLLPSSKITTEQFWEQLEQRIYAALRHYAEHVENGGSFQRRLFAEDTARGFAFIDICRKHYDVVGMNPPFGERPETCENYLQRNYAETVGDFFSMFYERALLLAGSRGKVGAITNRTWLGLPTFEAFRKNVFGKLGCIEVAADLGSFVLDAQVETAAAIIDRNLRIDGRALWVRLLKTKSKEAALLQALTSANLGHRHETVFVASQQDFAALPTSAYGYWMSKRLIALYGPENSIGVRAAEVKQGTATADDFRFLRLAWEIPVVTIGLTSDWAPFAKGGEYSRFFDDIHLMICWKGNGREVDAFPGAYIRNSSFYGLPGITWPRRTTSPFGPRAFPAGCAFGDKGPVAFPKTGVSPYVLLAVLLSCPARLILSVRLGAGDDAPGSASRSYEVGLIRDLPFPTLSEPQVQALKHAAVRSTTLECLRVVEDDETTCHFVCCRLAAIEKIGSLRDGVALIVTQADDRFVEVCDLSARIDTVISEALGFTDSDRTVMWEEFERPLSAFDTNREPEISLFERAYFTKEPVPGESLPGGLEAEGDVRVLTRRKQQVVLRDREKICRLFEISPETFARTRKRLPRLRNEDVNEAVGSLIQYLFGCALGRWDVQYATTEKAAPGLPDPFGSLPVCPPGTLRNDKGLPAAQHEISPTYPIRVPWDGIFVDDPGHVLDIERRVREVIEIIWKERTDAIAHEASEILEMKSLREYFRKPAGFFADHLKRYSKSRRQAPIYWPLSTASGSYTLWIYYHRLNDDTLFKCIQKFVEPKLADVEKELAHLRSLMDSGEGSTKTRRQLDEAEQLRTELKEMRAELEHWAPRWKPNLNDGVLITACPLWKLFRLPKWRRDLEACWKELERGDYDWAHLAYTLWPDRVREKCKTDRSLAIGHGLEELCEVNPAAKKVRKGKSAKAEEAQELIDYE